MNGITGEIKNKEIYIIKGCYWTFWAAHDVHFSLVTYQNTHTISLFMCHFTNVKSKHNEVIQFKI